MFSLCYERLRLWVQNRETKTTYATEKTCRYAHLSRFIYVLHRFSARYDRYFAWHSPGASLQVRPLHGLYRFELVRRMSTIGHRY